MQSHYDQAEPAPALQQMDALRDDKKISMKLYSDPSFFFDLWSQEMLQDHKHKRNAKKKVTEHFSYMQFFLFKNNVCDCNVLAHSEFHAIVCRVL